MASARTSDHHPIPMQATRRGLALTTFALPRAVCGLVSDEPLACYFQLTPIDSTAALAMRKSVSQSPPLTPTPPIHWPSISTGTPPSMAVHRSGPAANARFLHAHHIDADKSDNHSSNIKLLCIRCHALEFQHAHVKENPDYSLFCAKFPKA